MPHSASAVPTSRSAYTGPMASRDFDPRRLDVAAFAAAGGELAGELTAEQLRRLSSATLAPAEHPFAALAVLKQGSRPN